MKLKNLTFALMILFLAVLSLAGIGWSVSFTLDIEFKESIGDVESFKYIVFLGVIMLGF